MAFVPIRNVAPSLVLFSKPYPNILMILANFQEPLLTAA